MVCCFECEGTEKTLFFLLSHRFTNDTKLMDANSYAEVPCPYCKPDDLEDWWRLHFVEFL